MDHCGVIGSLWPLCQDKYGLVVGLLKVIRMYK